METGGVSVRPPGSQTYPTQVNPIQFDTVPANHNPTNHILANHIPTNHILANYIPTNYSPANQIPTNHSPTNQIPIISQPIIAQPIKSQPIKSQPIKSQPIMSFSVTSHPIKSHLVWSLAVLCYSSASGGWQRRAWLEADSVTAELFHNTDFNQRGTHLRVGSNFRNG